MIKTPRQLAAEYCDKTNISFFDRLFTTERNIKIGAFLSGYNAGHSAGFEGAMKAHELVGAHLEKQMIEEMFVRMEPLLKEDK